MSLSKSLSTGEIPPAKVRRLDRENRAFQVRWEDQYYVMCVNNKPKCLLCSVVLCGNKESNVKRHYMTHADQVKNHQSAERVAHVAALKQKQQQEADDTQSSSSTDSTTVSSISTIHFSLSSYVSLLLASVLSGSCALSLSLAVSCCCQQK